MLSFDPTQCVVFLNGYRRAREISEFELDQAASCYGSMRAFDLWLYNEIYLAGNERAGRFIKPTFTPITDAWLHARKGFR